MDATRPELSGSNPPGPSEVSPASPPPVSLADQIFLGKDGLRPIWGLLLFLLFVIAFYTALSLLRHIARLDTFIPLWNFLVEEIVRVIAVIVPGLIMAKIEGRPFGDYGLPARAFLGRYFWLGMLWGIVALSVLMLALRGAGAFYFGSFSLHGARVVKFAVFFAVLFLVVAIFEEFFLRGYAQFTLARGVGFWLAAILLSLAFGAIHLPNKGEDVMGALGAAAIGLFFVFTLRRTGSLWFAVGMHTSWNWGETFFYSVPNSGLKVAGHLLNSSFQGPNWLTGGSVGPEASVLVFVLIGAMALLFHYRYPTRLEKTGDGPGPAPHSEVLSERSYQE